MKKLIALFLVVLTFSSCSEEIKFNDPGFQAYRDGILFRGIDVKAYKSASTNAIRFVALAEDEEVELRVANGNPGTYFFGTSNTGIKATYQSSFNDIELAYETKIINGPVANIASGIVAGGSGYTANCTTVAGVVTCSGSYPTSGGSGSGLTVSLSTNAVGAITAARVASPGNGYKAGDVITVVGGNGLGRVRVLNVEGSNGEIKITQNNGTIISGEFKFNAVQTTTNPLGGDLVNFQYGTFYQIPIIPEP